GSAELSMHIAGGEFAQKGLGREVEERNVAGGRYGKRRPVEWEQSAAFDLRPSARSPWRKDRVERIDLAGGDAEKLVGGQIAPGRVQYSFTEGAGKTLLGAEQDQRESCRSGTANVLVPGDQGNSSRDRDRDGLCVAVDGGELRARLLGSGGRDAAHGVYHRVELPGAFDPSGDVREPLGHGLTAFSAAGASGTAALM